MKMLKVDNLNVYYGKIHAIRDVSFEVNTGEIVSLIGANGAGKTTTLHTVSGLLRSTTGSITFDEKDISHLEPHKLIKYGIAHVPEGRHVFLQMTVLENLEMGAFSMNKVSKEDIERVYDLFPRLKERKSQVAGTLSGGEQQMLAMGRALLADPELIVLDEPSMGLSPLLVSEIFEIVKSFREAGKTVLLVEQNAKKAMAISDRVYVLETGSITTSGAAADLINDESIKKAYLGE